ncbi:hypothetical protein RPC_4108 [Rhodopseudomonas palustris BisB18]|uniref:Uncharacterized protein n=1 Tax=Rhodopseudomonas palustris (strain BisB18) TaxID=316056 RepID=Q20Z02_RHOPB
MGDQGAACPAGARANPGPRRPRDRPACPQPLLRRIQSAADPASELLRRHRVGGGMTRSIGALAVDAAIRQRRITCGAIGARKAVGRLFGSD